MICQGLGIIRPELQDIWMERIREWRAKIAALEREPKTIKVGRQATYDYPLLLGDLRICASGYVAGTWGIVNTSYMCSEEYSIQIS